jgi:Tfp pilus assembly protein PilX
MPDVAMPKAEQALSVLRQARLSRNEIAATMIAELVHQMAYTALRAREIDKSNAYRPLSHRTLVDAHRSRA